MKGGAEERRQSQLLHPHLYIPRDLDLPGFIPGFLSQSTIVGVYGVSSLLIVSLVWLLSGKEFNKGDSRFAARDYGVVAVEGITAVIGGLACLLAVYAIARRKSYRYILQLAISLGQLYGTAAYFLTSYLEGDNFAASLYFYYAYYIIANASWVVIPTLITIRCWKKILRSSPCPRSGRDQSPVRWNFLDCYLSIGGS